MEKKGRDPWKLFAGIVVIVGVLFLPRACLVGDRADGDRAELETLILKAHQGQTVSSSEAGPLIRKVCGCGSDVRQWTPEQTRCVARWASKFPE